MSGLTTLDAAKGMQRKHAKLMRDIDRGRSILPPDFAASAFIPDARIDAAGNRQRFFHLTRNALPFLFMGYIEPYNLLIFQVDQCQLTSRRNINCYCQLISQPLQLVHKF